MPHRQLIVQAALKEVPNWNFTEIKSIRSLANGPSSDVWLIEYNSAKYVLRIDKPFAQHLPLDRDNETIIHQLLTDKGISPKIIYSNTKKGILISEFIQGRVWNEKDLNSKEQLSLLARQLKKLHSLTPDVKPYPLMDGIKLYAERLNTDQARDWVSQACTFYAKMSQRPYVLCHNDLLPQNIIESDDNGKKRLWFIDLEYSGLGNPLFDVATITSHHNLSTDLSEYFLTEYFGERDAVTRNDLSLQIKINERLLALWYSVLSNQNPDDLESKRLLEEVVTRF